MPTCLRDYRTRRNSIRRRQGTPPYGGRPLAARIIRYNSQAFDGQIATTDFIGLAMTILEDSSYHLPIRRIGKHHNYSLFTIHSSLFTKTAAIPRDGCCLGIRITSPSGRRRRCARACSGTSSRSCRRTWSRACSPARRRRPYPPRGRARRASRRARSGRRSGNRR